MTSEAYGKFLCGVFEEWKRFDIGRLDIQLFAEIALVWSGGNTSLCWMAPTCGQVLIVEKDGSVYSCDHYVTPSHCIGDIMTELHREAQAQWRGIGRNDPCPCGSGRKAKQCCWSRRA